MQTIRRRIKPFRDARLADPSLPGHYLIIIDALDKIDWKGGSEFLRDLLNVINEHRFYHLEQVSVEEADADIAKYLKTSLPDFALRPGLWCRRLGCSSMLRPL